VLGIDLNSTKSVASPFGGGVKLAIQPHGLKPESADANGEALSVQAARGLAAAFKHKGGTVTLNLTPESLGQIKVKITVEDSKVSALIQTSTEQAKRLLETSGETLRAAMESKGLTVDRIQIAHTPVGLNDARESARTAAADLNQQNEHRSGQGGGSDGLADQGRSSSDGSRQGWQQAASQANDLFGLQATAGNGSDGSQEQLGAPIAMSALTRVETSREGVVRLSVDAVA
jgi:flagellar hook-length control protein FliK